VVAEDFEEAMKRLNPSESSYVVIVTRGHRDDMRCLRWAVQTRARYIGMIGSKRKTIAIFKELTGEGIPAKLFERVHAPVGLDIGAVTPEEIAVAITAELIAVRRHCERALPHMSWFLSHKSSEKAQPADPATESISESREE
jgi:xanthine dehydrogenase accessory factor